MKKYPDASSLVFDDVDPSFEVGCYLGLKEDDITTYPENKKLIDEVLDLMSQIEGCDRLVNNVASSLREVSFSEFIQELKRFRAKVYILSTASLIGVRLDDKVVEALLELDDSKLESIKTLVDGHISVTTPRGIKIETVKAFWDRIKDFEIQQKFEKIGPSLGLGLSKAGYDEFSKTFAPHKENIVEGVGNALKTLEKTYRPPFHQYGNLSPYNFCLGLSSFNSPEAGKHFEKNLETRYEIASSLLEGMPKWDIEAMKSDKEILAKLDRVLNTVLGMDEVGLTSLSEALSKGVDSSLDTFINMVKQSERKASFQRLSETLQINIKPDSIKAEKLDDQVLANWQKVNRIAPQFISEYLKQREEVISSSDDPEGLVMDETTKFLHVYEVSKALDMAKLAFDLELSQKGQQQYAQLPEVKRVEFDNAVRAFGKFIEGGSYEGWMPRLVAFKSKRPLNLKDFYKRIQRIQNQVKKLERSSLRTAPRFSIRQKIDAFKRYMVDREIRKLIGKRRKPKFTANDLMGFGVVGLLSTTVFIYTKDVISSIDERDSRPFVGAKAPAKTKTISKHSVQYKCFVDDEDRFGVERLSASSYEELLNNLAQIISDLNKLNTGNEHNTAYASKYEEYVSGVHNFFDQMYNYVNIASEGFNLDSIVDKYRGKVPIAAWNADRDKMIIDDKSITSKEHEAVKKFLEKVLDELYEKHREICSKSSNL